MEFSSWYLWEQLVFTVSAYPLFCQDNRRRANQKFHLVSSTETTWTEWPLCIPVGETAHWLQRKWMSGSTSWTAVGTFLLLRPVRKHEKTSAEIKNILFCVCLYSLSRKLSSRCLGLQTMQGQLWVNTEVEYPLYGWRLSSLSDQLLSLKVRATKSHAPVHLKSGQVVEAESAHCSGRKSLCCRLSVPQHPCCDLLSDWARTSKEAEDKTISGPRNWESVKSNLWTFCRNGHLKLYLQQCSVVSVVSLP